MFMSLPMLLMIAVYITAAVLPAILLLRYIYRHDTVEKEPPGLLLSLLLMGILAAWTSIVLETIAEMFLELLVTPGTYLHTILLAFLVVAMVEEGAKLFFLKWRSWHHPAFNYRFDGIVYAVFVSLGFAAYENIQYVFHYGLSVALPRALLAVPGHLSFSVFMGIFYGRARLCRGRENLIGVRRNLQVGYLCAVFFHGFYDACAMTGTALATVIFLMFVFGMFFLVYRLVQRESAADAPLC